MINVKANFKSTNKDLQCKICSEQIETTEHLFECEKTKVMLRDKVTVVPAVKNIHKDDIETLISMRNYAVEAMKLRENLETKL